MESLRLTVLHAFPDLRESTFRLLAEGWHCTAIEADGRFVFKFPKGEAAEKALLKEAAVLEAIHAQVTLPIPRTRIIGSASIFSVHEKLMGEHLVTEQYLALPTPAKDRLARELGRFYAALHGLSVARMAAAGAGPIGSWAAMPALIRAKAMPVLPLHLHEFAERTVAAFESLAPDPYGEVFGFFDGHGWNMAFDHQHGVLNGIYDFGDSGIGPLHQDFIYSNFIAADLTERTVSSYERLTNRTIDRVRIVTLTGLHRLLELAEESTSAHAPDMIRNVERWAATMRASVP